MKNFIYIMLFLISPIILNAEINRVNFVGNNWCPQHCINDKKKPGYLVEIAQEALNAVEISSSMTFQPWLRAIHVVNTGIYDGLLTPSQSEEKQLIRHSISLASQRFCFYSKKDTSIKLQELQDFNHKSIAFTKGNNLGKEFMTYIQDINNNISLTELVSNNEEFAPRIFKFLLKERVDAIAITEDFGDYYLGLNPSIKKEIQKQYCTNKEPLHIGLSHSNKDRSYKISKKIDEGLSIIKQNGTYDKILKKYFLK